ncbi:MAG: hypothetical protein IJJ15_06290 [Ruminococcus sp.]|nr:hypothetical protein [Ruminococcus sp.]
MKDREMLNAIFKNAKMGVVGINSVSRYAGMKLCSELKKQKKEYADICREAHRLQSMKDNPVKGLSAFAVKGSDMLSRMKLSYDSSDSKIAEMMINGSTMGITKIIRSRRAYEGHDARVDNLSQKLLMTEQNNIESMKGYL